MNSEKNNDGIDYECIEKIQKFGFKEYYSRYSTFSDRFLANLVDGIFLMLVLLPIYFLSINFIEIKANLYAYTLIMGLLPGVLAHVYQLSGISENVSLLWSILEVVTCLFSKRRRAIHDLIANTVVVKL